MREQTSSSITALGHRLLRYELALVIAWIGGMKFTAYEAQGIAPLVTKSLFLGWTYHVSTVRQFSAGLGVVEISIAVLIALRPKSRQACAIGSVAAKSDVSHRALILIFNTWMGTEPRWLSFSFGNGWAIPAQGSSSAWGCDLVAWRVAVRAIVT